MFFLKEMAVKWVVVVIVIVLFILVDVLFIYKLFFVAVFCTKQHYAGDSHRTAIRGMTLISVI